MSAAVRQGGSVRLSSTRTNYVPSYPTAEALAMHEEVAAGIANRRRARAERQAAEENAMSTWIFLASALESASVLMSVAVGTGGSVLASVIIGLGLGVVVNAAIVLFLLLNFVWSQREPEAEEPIDEEWPEEEETGWEGVHQIVDFWSSWGSPSAADVDEADDIVVDANGNTVAGVRLSLMPSSDAETAA